MSDNDAARDAGTAVETHRRLAAVMFTDLVGYTTLSQVSEALSLSLLEKHRKLLRNVFARYRGHEIRSMGDAFLVEFESALDATQCGIDIQDTVFNYNLEVEDEKIFVRIGIHLGDVIHRQGDIFGNVVNVASRIEPLADPGGICVSGQVYDLIRDQTDNEWVKLELHKLKDVRFPIDVYKIVFHRGRRTGSPASAYEPTDSLSRVAIETLAVISRQDMVSPENILTKVAVNRDSLSETLDRLESLGSITKVRSQKGSTYYQATEKGIELLGKWKTMASG